MPELTILSPSEQVAEHLRGELLRGRWRGTMPGVPTLAAELEIDHKAVASAIQLLEEDGLLIGQGVGRPRRIVPPRDHAPSALRVALLLCESADRRLDFMVEILHLLTEAGHAPFFADRTLGDLGMDVDRVVRLVRGTEADVWVVVAGPRAVLEWFAGQAVPVFALFGRRRGLPIASVGPDKSPAYVAAVRALAAQGHRRIVMLARPQRRNPQPGLPERTFLNALRAEGLTVGDYNFPDWDNTREGLQRCLKSLFQVIPPTAMVVQEAVLFSAVEQFLAGRRLRVPQEVSLVCADPDPTFAWREPSVAHIRTDSGPWVRRLVGWADNVSRGKEDRRQVFSEAEFVGGGTIGPVAAR